MKSFAVALAETVGGTRKAIEEILSHDDLPPEAAMALVRVIGRLHQLCDADYLELMRKVYDVEDPKRPVPAVDPARQEEPKTRAERTKRKQPQTQ